jgi:hypothetical protein
MLGSQGFGPFHPCLLRLPVGFFTGPSEPATGKDGESNHGNFGGAGGVAEMLMAVGGTTCEIAYGDQRRSMTLRPGEEIRMDGNLREG